MLAPTTLLRRPEAHLMRLIRFPHKTHAVSRFSSSSAAWSISTTDKLLADLGKQIVREDNHILVVNKPAGVLAHASIPDHLRSSAVEDLDLLSAYRLYLKEKYDKPGNVYLQCVNRVDQAVSGLMLLARTSKAAQRLNKAYHLRKVQKQYLCVVDGELRGAGKVMGAQSSYQEYWGGKSASASRRNGRLKRVVEEGGGGKKGRNKSNADGDLYWHALAHCLDTEEQVKTLVGVKTLTGKKHQVRRQMASIGHPIYGDSLYGSKSSQTFQQLELSQTICLHAGILEFNHPVQKHKVIRVSAPVPRYWKKALFNGLVLPPPGVDYYDEDRIASEVGLVDTRHEDLDTEADFNHTRR